MPYRKEGTGIIEYRDIEAKQQTIRRYTASEFSVLEQELKDYVKLDPKGIGDKIIAEKQKELDAITAAK